MKSSIFCSFAQTLKLIFLSLILILKFIVALVILSPILMSRSLVEILAKICRPDLYKILPRFNAVFAVPDSEELEETNIVILTLKIGGKLDFETLLATVSKFGFERKPNGELLYPEFQLYWEQWCGFPFWKWEQNFQVKNHVTFAGDLDDWKMRANQNFEASESAIKNAEIFLLRKPFPDQTSRWEIAVIENGTSDENENPEVQPYWFLLFKFHHALADGYSIFNLLMKYSDCPCSAKVSQNSGVGRCKSVWRTLFLPFTAAYEIVRVESSTSAKTNSMRIPSRKLLTSEKVIAKSARMSTAGLKSYSLLNQSSFTAALVTAISAGIHNYLKTQQGSGKNLPEFLLAQIPVPVPNRPEGLSNHFSTVCLKLPIGSKATISDKSRLRFCEKEVERAKYSSYKEAMYILIKLFGSLPSWLQKRAQHIGGSVEIASFPGPKQFVTFYGQPILDMYYNVICGQFGLDLCILTYNGWIRIVANADPHIFPKEEQLEELLHEIEIQILSCCSEIASRNEHVATIQID